MTWGVLVLMILLGVVKIVVTSLPNSAVNKIQQKLETHQKLAEDQAVIQMSGKRLDEAEKRQVIQAFNKAIFLEQYNVFRGYEQFYLQPTNGGTPFVIDVKKGRKTITIFLYCYHDHVDVVKQYKKKTIAYKLRSNYLQQYSEVAEAF